MDRLGFRVLPIIDKDYDTLGILPLTAKIFSFSYFPDYYRTTMTSEADSSINLDCSSTTSSTTKKSKKLNSPIHEFTRERKNHEPEKDEKGSKLLYCAFCEYSTSVTTNLRRHLQKNHEIDVLARENRTKKEAESRLKEYWNQAIKDETDEMKSYVLNSILNQQVLKQTLVELIVVRNLPFTVIQWPEFHAFCGSLNSIAKDALPTSPTTIVTYIQDLYQEQKDIVRKKLQSAMTSIHLSVDIWTSPNNYLLLGVCAHFIDDLEVLKKALLGLRTVSGHSGENQWDTLLPILQEYGIINKIGTLTADNSGTNDTLYRTISSFMHTQNIIWDPVIQRLRCQGHIINLAVQDFLFRDSISIETISAYEEEEMNGKDLNEKQKKEKQAAFRAMGVLGKLHNIVVYSRSSAARTANFKNIVERMIPLDNRTRWNSWYLLLEAALKVEGKIGDFTKEHWEDLEKDALLI